MSPLKIKIGTALAAMATGGGFALAVPSSPAVAYSSPGLFLDVSIQSPAHLVARGAGVSVPVIVTCNAQSAQLQVRVTEKVGNKSATGYNDVLVGCTGGHQTVLVTIPPSAGTAFAKGSAFAEAVIFGCSYYDCGQESTSATIQIIK